MSWTDYNPLTNDNTSTMHDIIVGDLVVSTTVNFGDFVGEHQDDGQRAALFGDLIYPANYPVPVVDHTGHFQGWATFHITDASQGGKTVTGYLQVQLRQRATLDQLLLGGRQRLSPATSG